MSDQNQAQSKERLPVNSWQVNQLAKHWLRVAKAPWDDTLPYLIQLTWWGFEQDGLPVPGRGQRWKADLSLAAGQMLSHRFDPVKLTRWFMNSPNAGEMPEQHETLMSL